MKRIITLLLAAALVLTLLLPLGCESKYKTPFEVFQPVVPFTITYTYPPNDNHEFPLTGSLAVRYNAALEANVSANLISLREVREDSTAVAVPVTVQVQDASLIIKPTQPLKPVSHYELTVSSDIRSKDGATTSAPPGGFTFAFDTEADRPQAGKTLAVTSVIPDPSDQVYDISNFRVSFSEPVDQRSVVYGDTVLFTDDAGNLIEGTVFSRASQIVFDPAQDLTPGKYTLTITGDLKDAGGERMLNDVTYTFNVKSSYPHATIYAENCPTFSDPNHSSCPSESSADLLPPLPLTGNPTNSMTVDSHLLGSSSVYMSGQLKVEQCSPTGHPNIIPLVIRKGQRLYATSLPATLGGKIPLGVETGTITIQLMTDAVGFMTSSDLNGIVPGATVMLALTMDSAIVTENVDTNVMMTQDILGTQLFGQLTVDPDNGHLIMQLAGTAEIFILGERTPSNMSLEMHDALEVLDQPADVLPPSLRLSRPLNGAKEVRLADDMMLLFDEPVDPITARQFIRLETAAGAPIPQDVLVNSAKVIVRPLVPLQANTTYAVHIISGLADLEGNATTITKSVFFTTGSLESDAEPPMLLSTSPSPSFTPATPGHLPFEIFFSQVMDPNTIVLGDTLKIIDLSAGQLDVPGTLVNHWYRFTFYPNEPLIAGHYYRIILSDRITNYDGVGLDLDRDHTPGGPPGVTEIWIDFVAAGANGWQQLILGAEPMVDRDGSGYIDNTETEPDPANNYFKIFLIKNKSYSNGYIVSYVRGLEYDNEGQPFMDIIMVEGNKLWATSTGLTFKELVDAVAMADPLAASALEAAPPSGFFGPMGRILIDFTAIGLAPTVLSTTGQPQMNIKMATYMTLDNTTFNSMLDHNLAIDAVGILSFTPDGKMVADITSNATMKMNLTIPLINITIPIPLPVKIKMRQTSLDPADWWNSL
jgi:hypothetical protein